MAWKPRYTITDAVADALFEIGRAQGAVESHSWPALIEEEIRYKARLRSAHYSTRIEGNRLTIAEAEAVVQGRRVAFAGRQRDVAEVERYWKALAQVQQWADQKVPITEQLLRKLHALVDKGARRRPTPYRRVQNFVRDAATGRILYAPPEPSDVPGLMADLVEWIIAAERKGTSPAVAAGLVHYQFVTIHPFMDGNGRTARLLATLVLHRAGLGLRGFYSLEEYHARDLVEYYRQLAAHPDHNYYSGRADVDLTTWVEYFTRGVARVFTVAAAEALRLAAHGPVIEPDELRALEPRARRVLALFAARDEIRSSDVAHLFSISARAARIAIQRWVDEGFLEVANESNKRRSYCLSEVYRKHIGRLPEALARSPRTRTSSTKA